MKKILLPLLYVGIICIMVMCVILVLSGIQGYVNESPNYKYTLDNVFMSDIMNVVSEVNDRFVRPYISEDVSVKRFFYNKNDSKEKQEKSLISYENTYIQNKGVDYTSKEMFDVVSICDGEVINIENSELYGTVVTIGYNNLKLRYSNLSNVLINVGNQVSQGEIIGVSSISKFDNDETLLHFEVKYNDEYIDPESVYSLNISSFN